MPVDTALTAAVVTMLGRYCDTIDHQRFSEWADLFSLEGRFEYPPKLVTGRDDLLNFAAASPPGVHVSGAPVVTQSAETVDSVSSWAFLNAATGVMLAGYYHDSFVDTGDGLRFMVRRVEMLSSTQPHG